MKLTEDADKYCVRRLTIVSSILLGPNQINYYFSNSCNNLAGMYNGTASDLYLGNARFKPRLKYRLYITPSV
jgi:hypothetical protein